MFQWAGRLMRRALSLCLLGIAACPGAAPPNSDHQVDAAIDAPSSSATLTLSGRTMDYFGGVPVGDVAIVTDGIEPSLDTVSAPDGLFELSMFGGSSLYLHAAKTDYRLTRSTAISVMADSVMADAYVMS